MGYDHEEWSTPEMVLIKGECLVSIEKKVCNGSEESIVIDQFPNRLGVES